MALPAKQKLARANARARNAADDAATLKRARYFRAGGSMVGAYLGGRLDFDDKPVPVLGISAGYAGALVGLAADWFGLSDNEIGASVTGAAYGMAAAQFVRMGEEHKAKAALVGNTQNGG